MNGKQIIKCNVKSCAFNDTTKRVCELEGIVVEPCKNCDNGNPADESMCGSYEHVR